MVSAAAVLPWLSAAVLVVLAADSKERLIWRDEFQSLDTQVWDHLVTASRGFNSEFQYYRNNRSNSYVKNGILYLRPTFTADDYGENFLYNGTLYHPTCNLQPCCSSSGQDIVVPIQSARIRTINSFSFRYGRLEVRAQMPRGDWIWPAIWMKPQENAYGGWPASGEIDIAECRSNRKLTNNLGQSMGIDKMTAALHFGPNSSYNIWRPTYWESTLKDGKDYADDFHVYGLVWKEDSITLTIDGETIGSVVATPGGFWELGNFAVSPGGENIWANGGPLAPFDKKFFIIMNVAVGGRFFHDSLRNYPLPKPWNWSSPSPMKDFWQHRDWWMPTWKGEDAAMKVDYVRVYAFDAPDVKSAQSNWMRSQDHDREVRLTNVSKTSQPATTTPKPSTKTTTVRSITKKNPEVTTYRRPDVLPVRAVTDRPAVTFSDLWTTRLAVSQTQLPVNTRLVFQVPPQPSAIRYDNQASTTRLDYLAPSSLTSWRNLFLRRG